MSLGNNHWSSAASPFVPVFREVAPTIEGFARAIGAGLQRFHQDAPTWQVLYSRSIGGVASIEITFSVGDHVNLAGDEGPVVPVTGSSESLEVFVVSALWWVDSYDAGTRSSITATVGRMPRGSDSEGLRVLLDRALRQIAEWKTSDLDVSAKGFGWNEQMTPEQFAALQCASPTVDDTKWRR